MGLETRRRAAVLELSWLITANNWTPLPKWDYFFRWPFGHLKWPPASHLDIGHRQGTRLAWVTSRSTQPRSPTGHLGPRAPRGEKIPTVRIAVCGSPLRIKHKTRLCPLAGLYPCLYLCACACRVNVAPYSPAPDPPTTTANDGPLRCPLPTALQSVAFLSKSPKSQPSPHAALSTTALSKSPDVPVKSRPHFQERW